MKLNLILFCLFVILQIADAVTTYVALQKSAEESNPIMRGMIKRFGKFFGLAIPKAVVAAFIGCALYFYDSALIKFAMAGVCALYVAIAINNIRVIRSQKG